ncbi:MAG: response regulator [Candidatus Aminicenantes bacterium]|nr:response regulator [Candidatus Aminicenantes bacterium]NIM84719.1 response regulator [Candidatus Aminicenantes bacterium]NIN24213.1 response regulator [Candidatus Aminicenantes bacterium]NIN47940.1 response regulator [Candidatus Aminicenantes bacterium]NIN90876.1 response regulator [Candidatus Aminicenantes bacterium]
MRIILNGCVFCFVFFFLWTPAFLRALDPDKTITQYSVKVWNMESGLPGNSVIAVRQTQDGYLWIGTQNGLVRFDGVNFELFNRGKVPQLKSNVIRALYEDQNNTLWIGTDSGGLTRFKKGEFTTYSITQHPELNKISAIDEDQWGNLWIGSLTEGLTCLSRGKFTPYTTEHGLPHDKVRFIYKDGNRDLWAAAEAVVVKVVKPGVFKVYAPENVLSHSKTACLFKEETGELWIGTGSSGLFRLKDGKVTPFGSKEGILFPAITYLYKDGMNNLWIGTDGRGLTRMSNGKMSTFSGYGGLSEGSIYSIYEDREGSLWVGTLDHGLYQLRDSKFITYTTREGLPHDYINCIYESGDGDILIGTKGGLSRLKKRTTGTKETLSTVLTSRNGLLDNSVLDLFEDPGGYLWIATLAGLHRFKDGNLTILTQKHGLSDNRVRCIHGDRQGNTWIGTEDGLNRFDNNSGRFTVFTTREGLSGNFIEFIYEDSRGNLWISTEEGFNRLKDGVITELKSATGMEKELFLCAYEDKEGVLWFGTNSGLIRLKEEKTTLYTVQCGLIENDIYSILEDEKGYLWLAGRNGISRVRKKELEDCFGGKNAHVQTDWYNEKDGMKSRWCTGAGCKTQDGRFWFPTSVGIAVIDPNHIKKSNLAPSLIIEKFIVDGEPVNIQAKEKKHLELGPGKKRLEFYYTGVSFINPQRIRFKLKLAGYDSEWMDQGNLRSTTYTNLPPGHYTFNVIAANSDGVWNDKGVSFSFYLQPYFYETAWFYLSVILFVILSVFSFYRFRVRQLKTREKQLSSLVEVRTRDLTERNIELENARLKIQHSKDLIEAKNLQLESQTVQLKEQSEKLKEMDRVKSRFFANISHEFRTPLTLIMGPLEQMMSDSSDDTQKKKLNLMLRNTQRLLGLINQLLELSKFESGKVKLQASRQNIIPFLKGLVANFEPLADQHELDLAFQADVEDITLYVDTGKVEDMIYNLLINAVKFTPAGGKITVAAKRIAGKDETFPDGFLEISVSDTGLGIPREQLAHIFDRFYQSDSTYEHRKKGSGIGLALVKELVQVHHGKIDVYSREGKGTEFIIALPMGDAHLAADEIVERGVPVDVKDVPAVVKAHVPAEIRFETDDSDETDTTEAEEAVDVVAGEKDIILVVEDSVDVRDYIRGSLEPLYTVVEAKDGKEGIQKAREIIPDLIISDIMMPEVDGYELCNILKKDIKTSHIPMILLTAKASEESIVRGLETGADDYITKPFSTTILMARIKNLIDLRRQLQLNINREMTFQPAKISVSTIDEEFIKELQDVINKNLSDPDFNVELLAKKLYMDRSTIYRKVLALTGENPTEFIRSCRLKRGAELLKSNYTVLEVALEVGFSSANYFTKCFKKKFHRLPSTYQATEADS